MGEFSAVLEQQKQSGASPSAAVAAAGQAAADITVDFQRRGTWAGEINQVVPFFNAALQGTDKMARFIKKNPGKAAGRIFATTIIPSLISMLMNYEEEDYWAKPMRLRDRYWYFPTGLSDEGKRTYLRVPKPYGIGAFSIFTERSFARMFGIDPETGERGDKRAYDGLFQAMLMEFRPTISLAGLQPVIEVMAGDQGYSFYRDNEIVSSADKDLPLGLQGATRSSELARIMGAQLDYPPAKIDYLIQGFFGGLGKDVVGLIVDPAIRVVDPEAKAGQPIEFSDYLVIRRFMAGETRAGHEAVTRFFNDYEELERINRGLKAHEDNPKRRQKYAEDHQSALALWPRYKEARRRVGKDFSRLRELYRRRGEIPADELEKRVDQLYDRIIETARQTKITRNQIEEDN